MPKDESLALTETEERDINALYRDLHAHPELSMQEYRTQKRIEQYLDGLRVDHFRCGGTGVVGLIENGDGPVVAFRADSDALPILENTGLEYASSVHGQTADGAAVPVMHGCGHDTHVASLLGAVHVMLRERSKWSGTLVLIFQPGEEIAAGARAMVADGLWDRAPHPEVVLGQHVTPLEVGQIALSPGVAMSIADSLKVVLNGKQSHGSQPQNSIDPIVLGSTIVSRLQTIVSREIDPLKPAVVTVGTFHSGLKENIIPESAQLTINVRTLSEEVRADVLEAIDRIIRSEALASGAPEPAITKMYDFPINYNDETATDRVARSFTHRFGSAAVIDAGPRMGSEDFGYLGQAIGVPTVFWRFGGFDQLREPIPAMHSAEFAPNADTALPFGAAAAVAALMEWLAVDR